MTMHGRTRVGILEAGATTTLPITPPLEDGGMPIVRGDGVTVREWNPTAVTLANETNRRRPYVLLLLPRQAVDAGLAAAQATKSIAQFIRAVKGK